jgi:hypothetical protein
MPSTILGTIAGSQKDKVTQSSSSGVDAGAATGQELNAQNTMMDQFDWLKGAIANGPGQSDVKNAYSSQQDLASMLDQFSKGGYNPTESDIQGANSLYAKLFAPQNEALKQSFEDQNQNYARQAALMGRDINDPVFRAKLAYQQTRDQQMLDAQRNSAAMAYAQQQPFQRLNFAQAKSGILSGLATQAMANRQALAAMGEGIMNNERNFRLATATRWGNSTQESGGGLKGALMGAMAGMGQDMKLASSFMGVPSMGGAPTAGATMGPNQGPQLPAGYGSTYTMGPNMGPQQPMFAGANTGMSRSFM